MSNSKAYRTIIVDPDDQSIVEYSQWLDIHGIRKILGTNDVNADIVQMPDNTRIAIYTPIEFLLTGNMFTFQGMIKSVLRGQAVIIGLEPANDSKAPHSILNFVDCPFTLQEAKKLINWITIFDS